MQVLILSFQACPLSAVIPPAARFWVKQKRPLKRPVIWSQERDASACGFYPHRRADCLRRSVCLCV